jgi:hypothetical protein
MIYEYAIEPELFATWCDPPRLARFVNNSFGLGTSRILSTDKKESRWKKSVYLAFESWLKSIPFSDDDEKNEAYKQHLRSRITELINGISEHSINRQNWKFQHVA